MKLSLSQNISRLRKANSMTQEQLAEALGLTFASVSKWERGVATPDLNYIAEMADLFGVSMDVLTGYQVRDSSCQALAERIHRLQKEKRYDEAAAEAEKALIRYPNDFRIAYRCGEMYYLSGLETGGDKRLERAIELLERAILLLPQNTDPEINELTIRSIIAQGYTALGQRERGIELMKKNNAGGFLNSFIGLSYSMSEAYKPEEAAPYLTRSFLDCVSAITRTMTGYANHYSRVKDYPSALEVCRWLVGFLESVKETEDSAAVMDKVLSAFYAECAHFSDILGRAEEVEPYLRRAYAVARRFDAAPVYKMDCIRFWIDCGKDAIVYDDIGASAIDAIEQQQFHQGDWSERIHRIWKKLKEDDSTDEEK